MRLLLRSILIVLPPAGLLTWFLFHSIGPRGADLMIAQRDVARVSISEGTLRNDILQARIGAVMNYDILVEDMNTLTGDADELAHHAMILAGDQILLTQLKDQVRAVEVVLEHFKSDNALLHNSRIYFSILDEKLLSATTNLNLAVTLARLGTVLLELNRHPTPTLQAAMREQLDRLRSMQSAGSTNASAEDLSLLLTHGYLLARLIPALNDDLTRIFDISTYDLRQAIRGSQDARRIHMEAQASRYRISLYTTAVILLAALVRIFLQWRTGEKLLRKREDIERVIANVSKRFLAAPFETYDQTMDDVLDMLGSAFGADRAYLIQTEHQPSGRLWCRPGCDRPASWPGELLQIATASAREGDVVLQANSIPTALRSALIAILAEHGVADWCGLLLRVADKPVALLGFDRVHSVEPWTHGDVGLIRMAGDVVQSALERRSALTERLRLEDSLSRGRRLEAIGVFASGIAHNFNNIMAAILGHAELLDDGVPVQAIFRRHVDEILRAGERAQELVSRILDFGTNRAGLYEPVAIDKLLNETASMLQVMLPPRIALRVELNVDKCLIRGDALQIQQVFLNLVRNAEQAITESGTIVIRANAITLRSTRVLSHDTVLPNDYVCIDVADSGGGMSPQTLLSIFEPFFTTRPAGTGLGLATVREVVRSHGGFLDVHSQLGVGSRFTIWLPIAQTQQVRPVMPSQGVGHSLLVLGQSQASVLCDEEVVAALGYEPIGFHNIEHAVAAAQSTPDRFDAVLIDVANRAELEKVLGRFHRLRPSLPLIVIRSGLRDEPSIDCPALGLTSCLRRPISPARLADVLAESMGQKTAASRGRKVDA